MQALNLGNDYGFLFLKKFVCFQKGPILEWAVFYTKPDILSPLWVFRYPNIKISIFIIKIVKNEINSPYIVYLFFEELISTKR
jgi:hypothetical protein